jgi:hypothetical protein
MTAEFLFNTPWYWLLGVAALGGVIFVRGNARRQTGLRNVGVTLIALAVLWSVVNYYVDTPLEICTRGTRRMVQAFDQRDWPGFASVLAPNADVAVLGSPLSIYTSRQQIVRNAEVAQDTYKLHSTRISSIAVQRAPAQITLVVRIWTDSDYAGGRPFPSDWKLDWQQTADGWRLIHITAMQIGQASTEHTARVFPRR